MATYNHLTNSDWIGVIISISILIIMAIFMYVLESEKVSETATKHTTDSH